MIPFGRILLLRSALLIVIAFCIAVAVVSEDMNVRAMAAGAAIVVEILRDAVLASGLKDVPGGRGQ